MRDRDKDRNRQTDRHKCGRIRYNARILPDRRKETRMETGKRS